MRSLNLIVFWITFLLVNILVYFVYELIYLSPHTNSDGQAVIGVGVTVLLIQMIKLLLAIMLISLTILAFIKRRLLTPLAVVNLVMMAVGLIVGYISV